MHTAQPTPVPASGQDPFRRSRADILHVLQTFADSGASSQRQFAEQEGIPHATFNYWQRQFSAPADDPIASFFCSVAGEQVLRCIVAAALVTGQKHKDVFSWLLECMPDLPRPAPKRPKPAGEWLPMAV